MITIIIFLLLLGNGALKCDHSEWLITLTNGYITRLLNNIKQHARLKPRINKYPRDTIISICSLLIFAWGFLMRWCKFLCPKWSLNLICVTTGGEREAKSCMYSKHLQKNNWTWPCFLYFYFDPEKIVVKSSFNF